MLLVTPSVNGRRGTITPFFLIALIVLMAALAVAIDYSFLAETRVEIQNATDAAALAGAAAFVDDSALFNSPAAAQNLIIQSRLEAMKYAQLNRVAGSPLLLSDNPNNFANGDIIFGYIDDPATKVFVQAQNLNDPSNTFLTSINAVRVIGRRTKARGNPAATLASRAFGLSFVDMTATSTAILDHNVIGFRANTMQPLPLAPIAILSDPLNAQSWEYNVTQQNGPLTGNGLHGINVQLTAPGSGTPNGYGLMLGTADIGTQLQTGITPGDLQSFGGQFVLDATNHLDVPVLALSDFSALAASLIALQGSAAARIFPLYSTYDTTENEVILSGFVAARVVGVQPMNGGLTVTLQPTMVSLAAAVTDASRRGVGGIAITNPYVVKARLVE
jgi:hypothetical protein